MTSTLGSTFRKEEFNSTVGIISSTSHFNEGLSLENVIVDSQVDRGGDFIQHEILQALPEGGEAISWDNMRAFRYLRL